MNSTNIMTLHTLSLTLQTFAFLILISAFIAIIYQTHKEL